ncbi:MAG: phenylalanine--tRNA ligase subunit beta, partial [Acidimicrobiales bacterium]
MRVPLSWLRDFAPFPAAAGDRSSVVDLGRVMDELGLVVEGVEWVGEGLSDVVVSRVLEITAIPGADRIRRVVVDAGAPAGVSGGASAGPVEVVCGAWNFSVGDLVPLAPVGAVLPGGFAIGRRKMRGVTSNGMLCSAKELGLGGDAAGILVLGRSADAAGGSGAASGAGGSGTAGGAGAAGGSGAVGGGGPEPGTPLAQALGISVDAVYDLAIETNRPDALCVAGVARDVAARLGLPFAVPGLGPAEVTWADLPDPGAPGGEGIVVGTGREELAELASVSIEAPELCPRFLARALVDVTVGSSPPWLAGRLTLAGMRPINSIVDASNYVMLELGQPTHPYDLDRLAGHGLTVRQAGAGEQLVTLDGVERVLGRDPRSGRPVDDCLICDAEGGPVGIAGIMGGSSSEISEGTTRVLLEAAYFDPMAVARTSRRLGLRTEASMRFERGCDPEGIDWAVERFCRLVSGGGAGGGGAGGAGAGGPAPSGGCPRPAAGSARVVPGTIEVRDQVPALAVVKVRTARVNAVLGTELSDDQIAGYLGPIGFMVTPAGPG